MDARAKRGTLCGILGAVFWGVSGVCSQFLFQHYTVDSIWLTVVRMLSAGAILLAVALVQQKKAVFAVFKQPKELAHLVLFAIGGLLLCQFSYLTAIQHSNSGTATVLQNISIVMVAVFVSCKNRKMPPPVQIFSVGLALLAFTGAWGWPAEFDMTAALLVCGIVLLGTVGAFSLFLQCIRDIGPVKATLFACIEPVTATALSAFLLGSVFTFADLIGFACILSTVFLLTLKKERKENPAAQ